MRSGLCSELAAAGRAALKASGCADIGLCAKGLEVWGGGEGTGRDTCSPIRALLRDPLAVWTQSTRAHPLVGVVTVGNVVWGLAVAVRF